MKCDEYNQYSVLCQDCDIPIKISCCKDLTQIIKENEKKDMSNTCGFKDSEMHYKAGKEITYDEYNKWYEENCAQCKYASDICMYGEE